MTYSLRQIAPPDAEPVSLETAKLQVRADGNEEDLLLGAQIVAAREYAETSTDRTIARRRWRMTMDGAPGRVIRLPRPPLVSVESITCITDDGPVLVDPADYHVDTENEPGRIRLADGASWPTLARVPNAFAVEFTAGYSEDDLPKGIQSAMLLFVGHLFTNREAVTSGVTATPVPMATDTLLMGFKVFG